MITIHDAIYALHPSVVSIRGEDAFDANENQVFYDMAQAQVKLAEMQEEEAVKQQAQIDAKASALAKLSALGLTADEIKAITGA